MSARNSPVGAPDASAIRNEHWADDDVRRHYSYGNSHSDLYRFLGQWSDLGTYLNIGYSDSRQRHWSKKAHLRLIDRIAEGLLALHNTGPYKGDDPPRLLDIASGRGGPAIRAHQKYGMDVCGLDFTSFNVRRANHNSATRKISPEHVGFTEGDALKLPVRNREYSLAWSIEAPAHFKDKGRFLKEAARVLKPRGAFAFADLLVVDRVVNASERNRRIYRGFLDAWDVPYLETIHSYRAKITKAGFTLRETEICTAKNLRYFEQYCRIFALFFRTPPLYRMYKGYVKARAGVDLDNVYEHVTRSYRALRLGMIDYGIFWAVRTA